MSWTSINIPLPTSTSVGCLSNQSANQSYVILAHQHRVNGQAHATNIRARVVWPSHVPQLCEAAMISYEPSFTMNLLVRRWVSFKHWSLDNTACNRSFMFYPNPLDLQAGREPHSALIARHCFEFWSWWNLLVIFYMSLASTNRHALASWNTNLDFNTRNHKRRRNTSKLARIKHCCIRNLSI